MSRGLWASMGIWMLQYPSQGRSAEPAQPTSPPAPGAPASAAPPTAAPAALVPAAPASTSPAAARQERPFPILEFQVEGNTLLPVIDVERAVTPYLGVKKTVKDVQAAQGQLERTYHDRGYNTVFVTIPQQKIDSGVIRLVVTESPVGKLKITGSRFHSLKVIRAKLAQLSPDTVPNFKEVQKELGEVNRSADLRVTPKLKASETPGRMDVELIVKDELPLHAIAEADNRYSANTTHTRVSGQLHYDNLFQSGQSVSFQYQIAPERPSDAKIWSASYVIPLPAHYVLAIYAIHSDSNVASVGSLDVIGKGDIFGLRLISPLPTSRLEFYHSFTAGFDYKDFKQSVFLQAGTDTIESPAKYPAFTLQYSATWVGAPPPENASSVAATATGRSATTLELDFNFLIRGLGTDWRQFAAKRAGADPSYIILHPVLGREQVLPGRWTLAATLDGQLASGPLINNEEYAAGGADSVRGYLEAERLADEGARATLELRTPQLLAKRFPHADQSYTFLFVDAARLHVLEALPGQEANFTLESAGLGLKFKAAGLSVTLDGARILKAGAFTPSGRYRGLFSVSYAY
jgi:hemolysin activation/secretion protein